MVVSAIKEPISTNNGSGVQAKLNNMEKGAHPTLGKTLGPYPMSPQTTAAIPSE
jgi:hypothetical protein